MLTRKSSTVACNKIAILLPLILVCILCCSKNGFSQTRTAETVKVVPFGIKSTSKLLSVTYSQVINNPTLICSDAGSEVASFTVSMLPKSQDFLGPYQTTGASLRAETIEKIKALQAAGTTQTRLFIEEIHVRKGGKDLVQPSIALICTL